MRAHVRTLLPSQYKVSTQLTRNTLWGLAGSAFSQTSTLLAGFVLGRMLGVTRFGELAFIQSTLLMLGNLGEGGLTLTTVKFTGRWRGADPERAGGLIGSSLRVTAISAVFMALLLAGLGPYFGRINLEFSWTELAAACGLLIFDMLNRIQLGALAGLEAFKASTRIYLWRGLLTLPGVWLGILWGNLGGALVAMATVSCATFAIGHVVLKKQCQLSAIPLGYTASFESRILPTSFSLWTSSLLLAGSTWTVTLLLSRHSGGLEQLGIFNAAARWSTALLFLPNVLFQVVLPMLSHKHAEEDYRSCGRIISVVLTVTICVTGLAALLIVALSPILMTWYGSEFAAGSPVLALAALGAVVSAVYTVGSGILWAMGTPTQMLRVDFVKTFLFVGLCLMGFASSAWNVTLASLLSFSAGSALLMLTVYRQMSDRTSKSYAVDCQ